MQVIRSGLSVPYRPTTKSPFRWLRGFYFKKWRKSFIFAGVKKNIDKIISL